MISQRHRRVRRWPRQGSRTWFWIGLLASALPVPAAAAIIGKPLPAIVIGGPIGLAMAAAAMRVERRYGGTPIWGWRR